MGRMKKALQFGTAFIIRNPSPAVSRILNIAGMDKLVKIEKYAGAEK
jgi:anti-anti-sigma regulatory factor